MMEKQVQRVRTAKDQAWISSWLQDRDHQEYKEDVSELDNTATFDPTTPPRRVPLVTYYEEVSPTNTSFSEGSVFDAPQSAGGAYIEDVFRDDIPDAAAISDSKWRRFNRRDRSSTAIVQAIVDADQWEADSDALYNHPTEVADDLQETFNVLKEASRATAEAPVDPDKPRPTWLTSCAQCIHADLPCSRKAPSCSRCKRKGQAALCLLYRRPYPEEILRPDAVWSTNLLLLKLKGEDEKIRKEKLKLADELQGAYIAGKDHKNWVFPSTDSPRGNYRTNGTRVQKVYPSEGKGDRKEKYSYQELCVAVDG